MGKSPKSAVEACETRPQHSTSPQVSRHHRISRKAYSLYRIYVLELLLRQRPLPPSRDGRHIPLRACHEKHLVDERRGHGYVSNTIRSSRYTIWDFLPKQILFQATRLSNFYFLCIGVPQTIPGISTTGNYTTILPLLFFILLTVLKEGHDDYRRHRLDQYENKKLTTVLAQQKSPNASSRQWRLPRLPFKTFEDEPIGAVDEPINSSTCWRKIQWRHLKVGEIVQIRRDEEIPADLVLLYATGENGLAYIETMALDGETNLKSRQTLPALMRYRDFECINECEAEFVLEDPNPDLYSFHGKVAVAEKTMPLSLNEVIFRGCTLRNTDLIYGMVINTGEECKIRMNANKHPHAKKPRLERFANQAVLTLIVYVVLLAVGLSMGYLLWQRSTERTSFYISNAPVAFQRIIVGFAIMFNNVM